MLHRRLTIAGRVQGVSYRDWAVGTACGLGLVGWVRNRRDGSVEAHVAGGADAVTAFAAACRQGPAAARVASVTVADAAPEPLAGFIRAPTA